jgi:translation initiation factor 3 subunit C
VCSAFSYLNLGFRLKDEKMVATIIDKVQEYLERQKLSAELCRIYLRKIEHLYYKFDPDVLKQKQVSMLSEGNYKTILLALVCLSFTECKFPCVSYCVL